MADSNHAAQIDRIVPSQPTNNIRCGSDVAKRSWPTTALLTHSPEFDAPHAEAVPRPDH
jgi:hypothetical protein